MEYAQGAEHAVPEVSQYITSAGSSGNAPAGDQQVVAKLLVGNQIAGSIIGKSGANIELLQKSSGARIQLSRTGEFFPGTSDRVLLLSGSMHSVLTSICLILEKVSRDGTASGKPRATGVDDGEGSQVKLALSRRLCGLLIGHRGQTVRDFINDSGSSIKVQSLSELTPSDPERTITVSGARDQVLRAVALILNTLSINEEYASYMETTMQLATNQGVVLPPRSSATKNVLNNVRSSLTLYLADDDVGAILGRKGQNLTDIQQSARVTIKVSDRSKMEPGLNEREVTITGLYGAVKLAEAMIAEKLTQSRARSSSMRPDDLDGIEEHDA